MRPGPYEVRVGIQDRPRHDPEEKRKAALQRLRDSIGHKRFDNLGTPSTEEWHNAYDAPIAVYRSFGEYMVTGRDPENPRIWGDNVQRQVGISREMIRTALRHAYWQEQFAESDIAWFASLERTRLIIGEAPFKGSHHGRQMVSS